MLDLDKIINIKHVLKFVKLDNISNLRKIEQDFIDTLFTELINKKMVNSWNLYKLFGIIISEFNYYYNNSDETNKYGKHYDLEDLPIKKVNKFNRNLLKDKIKIVENNTTNDIIISMDQKRKKCVILNFASSSTIGGGYSIGVLNTQEEQLCYTLDNLYGSLYKIAKDMGGTTPRTKNLEKLGTRKKYQYNNIFWWDKKVLYSWNIHLSRNNNFKYGKIYDTFDLEKHIYPNIFPLRDEKIEDITVISAAAPNLGKEGKKVFISKYTEDLDFILKHNTDIDNIIEELSNIEIFTIFKKIVYNICILNEKVFNNGTRSTDTKPTILVLGAFGAGVFSPEYNIDLYIKTIAKVMFDVLIDYKIYEYFEYIYFPMLEKDKYDIFVEAFNKKLKKSTNDCISYII